MEKDTVQELIDAITSPAFSHARAGTGCWREIRWIYHTDPASPSGVRLASAGTAGVVEPLMRELHKGGPLSPNERY